MYKAILIDLDGVLRLWPDDDLGVEGRHGLAPGSIREAAFSPSLLTRAITGLDDDNTWRRKTTQRLATDVDPSAAEQAVAEWSDFVGVINRQALDLLDRCLPKIQRILVTNATSRLQSDLDTLKLSGHFDAVINSSDLGIAKPDSRIFLHAMSTANAVAENTLYIDDSQENINSALQLGICSHRFVDHVGMATFLEAENVLLDTPAMRDQGRFR